MISKTQIDKLGDRLRRADVNEEDLRLLDEYRRSFSEAYEFVVQAIRAELGLEPTGRPAKSTSAIVEKLQRESIRLTQIQDIAGCRIIASDIDEQERIVASIQLLLKNYEIVDRRQEPSNGYRAVHVIVRHAGATVEVQVRTLLQHLWAEQSEKLSDVVDSRIKYGKGDEFIVAELLRSSGLIATQESQELEMAKMKKEVSDMLSWEGLTPEDKDKLERGRQVITDVQAEDAKTREKMLEILRNTIRFVESGGHDNAVSD